MNKKRNKRGSKAITCPTSFINLKTTNDMNLKQEHREMLGKFIATKGYEIMKGKTPITFKTVFDILKETIIQTKRLKDSYGNE